MLSKIVTANHLHEKMLCKLIFLLQVRSFSASSAKEEGSVKNQEESTNYDRVQVREHGSQDLPC
jgi:hypothetical protein